MTLQVQDNVGIENGRIDAFNGDQIVAFFSEVILEPGSGSNLLKSKQHASASLLSTDDGWRFEKDKNCQESQNLTLLSLK